MSPKVRSVGLNCHRTNATVSYAEVSTFTHCKAVFLSNNVQVRVYFELRDYFAKI